jgi:hypothetical protein
VTAQVIQRKSAKNIPSKAYELSVWASWPDVSFFAPVFGLFRAGCPAAVAWFVIAVVVDAVDGKPGWALAHISKEGFERVTPAVAYFDASAPVVFPKPCVGVGAAFYYTGPAAVCRGEFPVACMTVFVWVCFRDFEAQAPTRPCVANLEIVILDGGFTTAIAVA